MRCLYSIIRYVPDPARGEFVNVGVIAGSDLTGEWEVRCLDDLAASADRLAGDGSTISAVSEFVKEVGQVFYERRALGRPLLEGPPPVPSEAWLDQVHTDSRNIVQLSEPAPIAADSISHAAGKVFELLVAVDGSG